MSSHRTPELVIFDCDGVLIDTEIVAAEIVSDYLRSEGADISTPIKKSGVFPPVVGYMIAVGEQAGELENMLDQVAAAYDEQVENTLALSILLRRFRPEYTGTEPPGISGTVTLTPRGGLNFKVHELS